MPPDLGAPDSPEGIRKTSLKALATQRCYYQLIAETVASFLVDSAVR